MRHYSSGEWLAFKEGHYDELTSGKMEEHLYACESCMEIFLETFNADDLQAAEKLIPADFTPRTMELLTSSSTGKPSLSQKPKTPNVQNLFLYYVAAAMLTLFFMGGGVFQSLVDNYDHLSSAAVNIERQTTKETTILDWSGVVAEKTAGWIADFENRNHEEVSK
ncbi:MAG: hypothetical protein PHT79_09435 [Syntrophomonadaceae bacterium]|nr:hypothetical protein [Syntrophomonadaceae bacterium]